MDGNSAGFEGGELDFLRMVENPTWKDVLLGLVSSERIDPWNIDVVDITSKYIGAVQGMKQTDLHIPANMILAAAIMVRIKSEAIVIKDEYVSDFGDVELPPELDFSTSFNYIDSIPGLVYRPKFPRKRKVTLDELLSAVEDALYSETKRGRRAPPPPPDTSIFNIDTGKVDVEEVMGRVYEDVIQRSDKYGLTKFSDISPEGVEGKVVSFLALLYLHSYGFVDLMQEKFFGEILVKVIDRERSVSDISITL